MEMQSASTNGLRESSIDTRRIRQRRRPVRLSIEALEERCLLSQCIAPGLGQPVEAEVATPQQASRETSTSESQVASSSTPTDAAVAESVTITGGASLIVAECPPSDPVTSNPASDSSTGSTRSLWSSLSDWWDQATAFVGALPGAIADTFSSGEAWDSLQGAVTGAIDTITDGIENVTGLPVGTDLIEIPALYGHQDALNEGAVVGYYTVMVEIAVGSAYVTVYGAYYTAAGLVSMGTTGGTLLGVTEAGTVLISGGSTVSIGAVIVTAEGVVVTTVGVGLGELTVEMASQGPPSSQGPPEQPSETFDSVDDAIGEISPDGATILGTEATGNANLVDMGYTVTIYAEDTAGVQWTVWHNPTTGQYFAHPSSGFRGL